MRNTLGFARRRVSFVLSSSLGLLVGARGAEAAVYHYVDWTAADVAKGTAAGTITLPDSSTVSVTFAAINADATGGNLYGAQITGAQTNYWSPATPFISPEVENAPPGTDILQLAGGQNQTYEVTLSEPIKDPIMAIVSLGAPATTITYDFDAPYTIVSQGPGYWGGSTTSLVPLPDDVLQGTEGHGTIRFVGTFAKFSWTVPKPESWHGFTFGIRTTERIEPTVDGGATSDAASDDGSIIDDGGLVSPRKGESGCRCNTTNGGPEALAGTLLAALMLVVSRRR